MVLLHAENVHCVRHGERVLAEIDLTLAAGEFIGIIGPNGAGKSTLLRILAGLAAPSSGRVLLEGAELHGLAPRLRAQRLGYHPQHPELHWPLAVCDIVALGRLPYTGGRGRLSVQDETALQSAIEQCGLEPLLARRGDSLSGGELARVHIARLLAGAHRVLLADEPIANLDPRFQIDILTALRGHAARGGGAIVVLHDLNVAARFCDRLLLLDGGRASAVGTPHDVLSPERIARVFAVAPDYLTDTGIAQALAARAPH